MIEFLVDLGDRKYPIIIQPSGLKNIGNLIQHHRLGEQAVMITDQTVMKLYGKEVQNALKEVGIRSTLQIVPDGESSKSLKQVLRRAGSPLELLSEVEGRLNLSTPPALRGTCYPLESRIGFC